MSKFEPLTAEEVRWAEEESIKSLRRETQEKEYKVRTPPWRVNWVKKYLPVFSNKQKRKIQFPEEKTLRGKEKGERSRVLGRFRAMFPFDLFPDELVVEEKRVIWINRILPMYSRAISIMATDISNVEAAHGPFFGHIHIGSLVGGPEILIERLSRRDCIKARALVEGIILAEREGAKLRKREVEVEKEALSEAGEIKF